MTTVTNELRMIETLFREDIYDIEYNEDDMLYIECNKEKYNEDNELEEHCYRLTIEYDDDRYWITFKLERKYYDKDTMEYKGCNHIDYYNDVMLRNIHSVLDFIKHNVKDFIKAKLEYISYID